MRNIKLLISINTEYSQGVLAFNLSEQVLVYSSSAENAVKLVRGSGICPSGYLMVRLRYLPPARRIFFFRKGVADGRHEYLEKNSHVIKEYSGESITIGLSHFPSRSSTVLHSLKPEQVAGEILNLFQGKGMQLQYLGFNPSQKGLGKQGRVFQMGISGRPIQATTESDLPPSSSASSSSPPVANSPAVQMGIGGRPIQATTESGSPPSSSSSSSSSLVANSSAVQMGIGGHPIPVTTESDSPSSSSSSSSSSPKFIEGVRNIKLLVPINIRLQRVLVFNLSEQVLVCQSSAEDAVKLVRQSGIPASEYFMVCLSSSPASRIFFFRKGVADGRLEYLEKNSHFIKEYSEESISIGLGLLSASSAVLRSLEPEEVADKILNLFQGRRMQLEYLGFNLSQKRPGEQGRAFQMGVSEHPISATTESDSPPSSSLSSSSSLVANSPAVLSGEPTKDAVMGMEADFVASSSLSSSSSSAASSLAVPSDLLEQGLFSELPEEALNDESAGAASGFFSVLANEAESLGVASDAAEAAALADDFRPQDHGDGSLAEFLERAGLFGPGAHRSASKAGLFDSPAKKPRLGSYD